MYNDNDNFEKFPERVENLGERVVPDGEDFEKAFSQDGVPEFVGEKFGVVGEENEYFGGNVEEDEYNDGLADAAALINYGLDAAAREIGVEQVIQRVKSFDATGSEDPIGDLYKYIGIDTPEERRDVGEEAIAAKPAEVEFREELGMPKTEKRSVEGAFKAIADTKELIAEVEGADPRYDELRENAKAAGMGYFEYAVKDFGARGLTELFGVLAKQRGKMEEVEREEVTENDDEKENTEEIEDEEEESKVTLKKEDKVEGEEEEKNDDEEQEEIEVEGIEIKRDAT